MSYTDFFCTATGLDQPWPYQTALAEKASWPEALNVPTGMGKTAAVTLAWAYKRGWRENGRNTSPNKDTPRRLIWCLPMRVLVEQTEHNLIQWLDKLGIYSETPCEGKVSVHKLMGGESDLRSWAEHPEQDMILIGTQDMLLSRALMRGYGMSRYQWPIHFALLHNDCLWAFDEVQLMGPGLTTSTQLEAFRRQLPLAQGSRSLWLSATLAPDWLSTVDFQAYLPGLMDSTLKLGDADSRAAGERLNASKVLETAAPGLNATSNNKAGLSAYLQSLCDAILEAHDPDQQTLVILNRVDRAQQLFRLLLKARPDQHDLLIHARFRPLERQANEQRLQSESDKNRIIVATQAIEAGVDISCKTLFTELAPWASMVQRFGRCNRYGEHNENGGAKVYWIDIEDGADSSTRLPYDQEMLDESRSKLHGLDAVGPNDLPDTHSPRPSYPVLRRKDLLDLFNTDPDLSGFDVDVSDYIRDTGNPGLQVFWRDFEAPNSPHKQSPPQRLELCPISIGQAKDLHKQGAWVWDGLAGEWQSLKAGPRPGMVIMLKAANGNYDEQLGFLKSKSPVSTFPPEEKTPPADFPGDWRSRTRHPVLLTDHLGHVAGEAAVLCESLNESFHDVIVRSARWHDLGKAHEVFDASMHRCEEAPAGLLAKSNCAGPMRHNRSYFRHELASALAWLQQHDDPAVTNTTIDLIAYLIAAHHGKVRMSLRAMPGEAPAPDKRRFARGIWEGDSLPSLDFDGEHSAEISLNLAIMELGDSEQGRSWTARTLALLDEHGPFRLAWLETLVRLADWRASAKEQDAEQDAKQQDAQNKQEAPSS